MELTDSSEINTRSPLGIDLNEIPSSSSPPCASLPKPEFEPEQLEPDPLELDSFDVVRSFHENQDPASGIAAGLPEEEKLPTCGACGEPEVDGRVVVCDGCERGFHLTCAGMHVRQMVNLVDWICAECFSGGVKSKRWPLGVKSKLILDINASPPSDCDPDGESSEERVNLRKHGIGDNSSCRNAFGALVSHSNHLYEGNDFGPFDFNNGSGLMMNAFRVDFEDILHPAQTVNRSLEEIDLGFPVGRLRSSNNTSIILPSQNPHEVLLHSLREFVSERNGILDEGWHVELKHCTSSYEVYAVYCSPDGKTFSSMSEVASYLGLPHSTSTMAADAKNNESPSVQERLRLPKKRKAKSFSLANGFAANKQALADGCQKGLMPNGQTAEIGDTKFDKFTEADAEEDDIAKSSASDDGFPVQFEDFFVISLGKIDVRPSYHDCHLIWPVGYKSCWHDKVTGSLFVCEVLDGGDNGPVFKVRRFSCSALPIPDVSTVIYGKNSGMSAGQTMNYDDAVCSEMECENDVTVETILADTSPPTEDDILTYLKPSSNETCGIWVSESLQDCIPSSSGILSSSDLGLADDIVELSSEERSSCLAWRVVSQKLIEVFSEICNQKGSLKLCCKHVDYDLGLPAWDTKDERAMINFDSLAKFCSSPISVDIPLDYQGEVDRLAAALSKWLDQDRFGFDTHFVQEIIEQLPGVDSCSKYERLINRSNCSISITVGNGQLIAKRKNRAELDDKCQKSKRARLGEDNCETDKHYPPPGRLLCSKCPPVLVGDLYQVWELLFRFHELLGLKEPLLLENLEDELINPWFGGTNFPDNHHGKKVHESQLLDLDKINGTNGPVSCSYQESCECNHGDNSNLLMHLEKETMNDSNQDRISAIYSGCAGVALTKVHSSLLSVLIGELQSKVAAIVDPNFDAGESKSRKGRRKDADSLNPLKRNKLTTLPINGLTWPELARRYILAVLSMDGNLDSAESAARESVKVFRCLRGDGGVVCGSLAGVAGMEADALFLAEATKQIYGYLSTGKDILIFEEEVTDANGSSEKNSVNDGNIPEWALLLEPVRRLPTNVGTRIRKCVYEALEKDPPEWAKKRLEHSISKGVYKGNASGPTKKAVLSVLADVFTEGLPHKCEKRNKRKITLPISDIVMKQCRIVLRQAAAAADAKFFCTLLGQNLVTSCDHDDEGLLGSPAMVSRPLDLRTIDLRLAVGAYGGSHASFLEDIRELWNNVRIAFRDQPVMVELAETLAHNFESLYEKEVVTLVQKLEGYAKLDNLSTETKKELDDILASINEIPKAPWDEGVCKVCGVDRDDDNVLLCDMCDAEYHTYCLNPPLARIPEGNWYCPSCVGASMVQEASSSSQVMGHTHCKKYQGEITRVYLETLMHLAVAMEEKDYWDFVIDERTFLLRFLCDELLNSALVRQHLEQCTETTAELQQKLRSLFVEWRNLKFKKEILASRAAKVDAGATEEAKDGFGSLLTNQGRSIGHSPHLSDKSSQFSAGSDGAPAVDGSQKGNGTYGPDKHSSVINYTKKTNCDSQAINSKDAEGKLKDLHGIRNGTNQENKKSSRPSGLSSSDELLQVSDNVDEIRGLSNMEECMGRESSTFLPPSDRPGSSISLEENNHVLENVPTHAVNESQVYNSELSAIKVDILHLQSLINSVKSKLSKQSSRREFLGNDSRGHLYWSSTTCDGHPRIIIDGSLTLQRRKISDHRDLFYRCSLLQHSYSSETNTCLKLEGSRACFPFLFDTNGAVYSWISYESEAEIEELIDWLGNNDPKERELKESILQLLKLRFREHQQIREPSDEKCHESVVMDNDEISSSNCLATKAALFLEKKYGACMELETTALLKRGKKTRGLTKEMYRCYCLEPIWPSRHHCHSCHRTSSNDDVFEGHDDGSCYLDHLSCEKSKEKNESTRAKGRDKSQVLDKEYISEMDNVLNARIGWSELGSRLIKFQNAGFECPYEFTEICSKFVTKDSNKELVEDIGLIGSNGIPTFVTSVSPYLSDSTLVLTCPKKDTTVQCDNLDVLDHQLVMQGNKNESNSGLQSLSGKFAWKTATNEIGELLTNNPRLGLHQLGRKSSFNKCFPEMHSISHCVVPQSSLKPLLGKALLILRRLKINLLDMEAALPEEALRLSRGCFGRRWTWRAFVKSAESIYQMIQATVVLEEMIKTEYLRNEWWYWSSRSAAAKTSTVSSLALRIYSLDACIIYEKTLSNSDPVGNLKPSSISNQKINCMDSVDKCRVSRKSNKKRKEPEG